MGPFDLSTFNQVVAILIYLGIGFSFGFVLEQAGFGDSRKLSAQFYFKDMTVFKVMFTAIIVAMVLVFLSASLGFLNYDKIWVNPTYLTPGVVGGLIMGFGFIIGGFCPGTSLVSLATFKLDGVSFAVGVLFGIFVFGETVSYFEGFWTSDYYGRFTLSQLFDMDSGVLTLIIVASALVLFVLAEKVENTMKKAGR